MSSQELVRIAADAGCKVIHEDEKHIVKFGMHHEGAIVFPNVKELAREILKKVAELLHLDLD